MALRFKLPVEIAVSGGWNGEVARIVEILSEGSADGTRKGRPVITLIRQAVLRDKAFLTAVARGDRRAAALALRRVAMRIIGPGVKPMNKPSTAARKGGDRRALRNVRGRDRIYTQFKTDPPTE